MRIQPVAVLYKRPKDGIVMMVRVEEFKLQGYGGPIHEDDIDRWLAMIKEGEDKGYAMGYSNILNSDDIIVIAEEER